jgi:hypothetical protein
VRFTVPILYYYFDFEFLNQSQLIDKPKVNAAAIKNPYIPVKLVNRGPILN